MLSLAETTILMVLHCKLGSSANVRHRT
jgi:hypothetical protein